MEIGSTSISRVALTLEMLLCFGAATLLLIGLPLSAVFGAWPDVWSTRLSLLLLSTSLIGPLGLGVAFRFIVLERKDLSRTLAFVLCGLAMWTFVGNAAFSLSVASPGYQWRALTLMAVLPLVGAVHLACMAKTKAGRAPAAA